MASRKSSGIIGTITQLITFVIIAGLFIAFISRFDYDPIAAFMWLINWIWDLILTVANVIAGNETFRQVTG